MSLFEENYFTTPSLTLECSECEWSVTNTRKGGICADILAKEMVEKYNFKEGICQKCQEAIEAEYNEQRLDEAFVIRQCSMN